MSLSILNNIAALYAQNNLTSSQSGLQNTLNQLSSGSRINSGADDASGLAVADGLHANEAALTQSAQNASSGIGLLQTADGSLSQVTNLLDRAVTLATESANGTLTSSQVSSANQEYQNILSQIGNIGSTSNFNSSAVFSSTATNIVVTDGTTGGLNTYADTVGTLSTASVGTTAASNITSSAVAATIVSPTSATSTTAGVYALTPNAASDGLSGTLAITVGSGTPINVNVAPGTNIATLENQLNSNTSFSAAGLTATLTSSNTVLTITGPTTGSTAAANTVSFTGSTLEDAVTTAPSFAVGTAAVAQVATSSTQTFASAVSGDALTSGTTLTYAVAGGATNTFTLGAGVTLDNNSTTGISTKLNADATFKAAGLTANVTASGVLTVSGAAGTVETIALGGTIADTTHAGTGTPANNVTVGAAGTAGVKTLTLNGGTDTFSGKVDITSGTNSTQTLDLSGLNGTQAAALITNNTTLKGEGVSAAFNASTGVLSVTGSSTGSTIAVGSNGGSPLVDNKAIATSVTTAATGGPSQGGTATITLGSATDALSGTLALTVGTSGLAKDSLSLKIAAGTTGSQLASNINSNSSFQTAGVTAAFDSTSGAVTLTGPTGTTNTLSTTGSTLTDSTSAAPQGGANFRTTSTSQLTAANASTILTTVTAAIADVAYQRGTLGADINQLTSASNVASSESVNLTSAEQNIRATDYGQAASQLSKYQILSQTGISALAQANSVQQEVLKLLQ